ncbi:putative transcriptional regulator [Gordonia namibiensis NBRC 108229]|uniref:Putative transcriptional regulator n=1 Tax=Gordonia namibiensis NBRC 108229 TaxID=1208314 RepID=K6W2R5_9ACTN|nr:putative transcriptional regulator [Gordonia namibiensis NBRC 108229]
MATSAPMPAIRVLGPLSVTAADGSPIRMTARKHADLLAILTAERTACSPERVAELLWRGDPPPSATSTLHGYVSRLRRSLGPAESVRIDTVPTGYVLHCDGPATDLDLLDKLGTEGLDLVRTDPRAGAEVLCRALDLWRGDPLAEIADIAELAPELGRLDEMRSELTETAADALRSVGEHRRAAALLTPLCRRHPYREGAVRSLVRALHDDGRTADALDAIRRLRQALRDDLGLDPGPETLALESELREPVPVTATVRIPPPPEARELVGRTVEVGVLEQVWRAGENNPAGALLIGPSGIGKTALVEQLLTRHDAHARRFIGRAGDSGSAFGGIAELFGDGHAGGEIPTAADIAANVWTDINERGRSVLVLDDLQWLDTDSARVLARVIAGLGRIPVTVLATCRDATAEPVTIIGSALERHAPVTRLRVAELSSDEIRALIDARLADLGPSSQVDRDDLAAQALGSPMVARQLCDAAAIGAIPDTDHPAQTMIAARFDELSKEASRLMVAIAVSGGELTDGVVAELAEPVGTRLIGELRRAGLVDNAGDGGIVVAHDAVREGIVARTSRTQRVEAHARLASAIESARPHDLEAIAVHRVESAIDESSVALAIRACVLAAHRSVDASADHRALELARRGLTLPQPDADLAVDLHRIAGTAAIRTGQFDSARASFESAAAISRELGDWPALAETALLASPRGVAGYWSGFGIVQSDDSALAREALAHAESLAPEVTARLHATEAARLSVLGMSGAEDHLGAARVVYAGAAGDYEVALAEFLVNWEPTRLADRRKIARELYEMSAGNHDLRATAVHLQRVCALEAGDVRMARRLSAEFARLVGRGSGTDLDTMQLWWQVMLALLRGDYEVSTSLAEKFAATVGGLSERARLLGEASMATSASIQAWHRGELASMLPAFDTLAEEVDDDFALVIALGSAEAGNHDRALRLATELTADAHRWTGSRVVARVPLLIEALYSISLDAGRVEGAREICRRIVHLVGDWSSGLIVQWPGLVCLGPAVMFRGTARIILGEDGTEDLREAIRLARDTGARPYELRARRRLGAVTAGTVPSADV